MSDQPSINVVALQLWAGSWQDWTGDVASISIQRGGGVTVDVGLMTVVLIRDDDPLADEDILASQPIRVVRAGTSETIFTGIVEDAAVGIVRDAGGRVRNGITITAVDAVASHTKNTRYGAVTDGGVGHETWAARIARLALSSETTVSLPLEPDTPYAWECQDVAYVSSLAAHFDLACQTVGANWYVGSDNITRFRGPDDETASVATFSDQLDDPHQYLDIVVNSGSKQVVNVLKITNHGRGNDGNTYDIVETFEDSGSVLAWGARAASTDMCVWDADALLSGRAEVIFDAYADPVREVRQIVWDAQQNPALAALLDIQSPITVLQGADEFETRIVAMSHEIGPSSWSITMETSTRGVGEAQAVNDAYATIPATGATPVDRDARAPQVPTGLAVDPFAAWQGGEIVLAISAEWDAVTIGDNGAPIDVSLYEVWGRPSDGTTPAKRVGTTAGLEVAATDPAFAIGDEWLVKVRASSKNGVWSPFSAEESVTLTEPAEELAVPTAPTDGGPAPGQIVGVWDGDLTDGPMPMFGMQVNAKIATSSSGPYTKVATLFRGGDRAVVPLAAGQSRYMVFTATDRLGRETAASAPVLLTSGSVTAGDLDTSVTEAIEAAQTTADGRNRIYRGSSTPSPTPAAVAGDVWYELNGSDQVIGVHIFDGSTWDAYQMVADSIVVPASVGNILIADGAITAPKIQAAAITAGKIAAAAVSATEIAAGVINVSHLSPLFGGQLDLSANDLIQLIAGELGETRSVFRVTPEGAEVRQEGIAAFLRLLAEAVQLIGPSGTVGAQLTAAGLEAPTVITNEVQFPNFTWSESDDGTHLTLR